MLHRFGKTKKWLVLVLVVSVVLVLVVSVVLVLVVLV